MAIQYQNLPEIQHREKFNQKQFKSQKVVKMGLKSEELSQNQESRQLCIYNYVFNQISTMTEWGAKNKKRQNSDEYHLI